ncbi:hypothetical protein DOM22_06910 [Bdellovibrio sp. ZAP7]|uniref:hypothetical protein n=1 Tax=Bdellovibrio sp. ZAP7 TaxID=2231053 RepID=UPI001158C0D3|nr:hypothetical protein [Bdellovibrio sp. ZAP7]QDK44910.1 hypothetical protein DOM22_06910 [Bdellovibrio sp. ZAP7]
MKKFISLMMILNLSVIAHAAPPAEEEGVEPEDGPFYVMDYDEFKNITKEQKAYYLGKLIVEIPKVSALNDISKDDILAAGKSLQKWSDMSQKISKVCYGKSAPASCQGLRKARNDAFHQGEKR